MSENQSSSELTVESAPNLIEEIEKAYFDIPFGNTTFQTEAFIVGASITPQRAYRAIGLQLHSILSTLRDHQQRLELAAIDADELRYKAENSTDQFEKRRAEVKLKHLTSQDNWSRKLLNDTLEEARVLYKHFQALPKFTREEFEQCEPLYFMEKLKREIAGVAGAHESLVNMTEGLPSLLEFQAQVRDDKSPAAITAAMTTVRIMKPAGETP